MSEQQWDVPAPSKSPTEQVADLLNGVVHKGKHGNMPLCEWMQICGGCKQGERCGECAPVYAIDGPIHGPDPQYPDANLRWNRNPFWQKSYDDPKDDPLFKCFVSGGYEVWEDK